MKVKILVTMLILSVLVVGCSMASNPEYKDAPAGFWDGVWHGMTYGFIVLWDTFFEVGDPALYAINNTGYWYNCGFACIAPLIWTIIFGIFGGILRAISG